MNTYDSIIPLFVSQDGLRSELMLPHLDGEDVIATNGHILVQVPKNKLSDKY